MAISIFILLIFAVAIYIFIDKRFREQQKDIEELKRKIDELSLGKSMVEKPISVSKQETQQPEIKFKKEPETVFKVSQNPAPVQENYEYQPNFIDKTVDFVKQNFLSILGILTLVLGIGYFVKYAVDQNWINENLRIILGILAGLALTGIGFYLRKNYSIFSSILCGGGISVLYFTITIAFREYHLFSQNVAFGILFLITCFAVFLAYYLKREVLIILAILGGFGSPLMISTGQSNYPFLFGYITLLNIGMLLIVYLRNWKSLGWICFILTNLYLGVWILDQPQKLAIAFIVAFYVIFYAFGLRNYFLQKKMELFDYFLLVLVNLTLVPLSVWLNKEIQFLPDSILVLIFAIPNVVLALKSYSTKKESLSFSVFIGIFVSLISLAVALQFKVHFITIFWAIESSLLLYLWTVTQKKIFKQSFFMLFGFTLLALLVTFAHYEDLKTRTAFFNPIFLSAFIVFLSGIFNFSLIKKSEKELKFFAFTCSYLVIYLAIFLELFSFMMIILKQNLP